MLIVDINSGASTFGTSSLLFLAIFLDADDGGAFIYVVEMVTVLEMTWIARWCQHDHFTTTAIVVLYISD